MESGTAGHAGASTDTVPRLTAGTQPGAVRLDRDVGAAPVLGGVAVKEHVARGPGCCGHLRNEEGRERRRQDREGGAAAWGHAHRWLGVRGSRGDRA